MRGWLRKHMWTDVAVENARMPFYCSFSAWTWVNWLPLSWFFFSVCSRVVCSLTPAQHVFLTWYTEMGNTNMGNPDERKTAENALWGDPEWWVAYPLHPHTCMCCSRKIPGSGSRLMTSHKISQLFLSSLCPKKTSHLLTCYNFTYAVRLRQFLAQMLPRK